MAEPISQDVLQAVLQAAQTAQEAAQTAQQIAQSVTQDIANLKQGVATTSSRIENADIGGSERIEKDQMAESGLLFANTKRTYDEYQDMSLKHARNLDNIAAQALQNAVETANIVAKQCIRHGDIAIDRQWNIDEVSDLSAKTGVQSDTIQAIVAAVTAAVLTELKPKA